MLVIFYLDPYQMEEEWFDIFAFSPNRSSQRNQIVMCWILTTLILVFQREIFCLGFLLCIEMMVLLFWEFVSLNFLKIQLQRSHLLIFLMKTHICTFWGNVDLSNAAHAVHAVHTLKVTQRTFFKDFSGFSDSSGLPDCVFEFRLSCLSRDNSIAQIGSLRWSPVKLSPIMMMMIMLII